MAEIKYTAWERMQIAAIEARGLKDSAALGWDAHIERRRALKRIEGKARRRANRT
ncbi:hypothetical protein [Streptomyces spectabilis]|uniref:Uncharacterized protein n=1 Tax=Streptomyces spectabilis TaxID=68270 RepID=A0A7W8ETY9_STRST|nr:hypothetical protein [Streptomyces spectabilis]MBB5103274.1 hypothetical protein [Streptomyces spectabilis]MCI3902465.1 hypothetical protein [Streptomyces spectabilis]GGV13699.1 hypothetical protein GCM10010245_23900 [Streptomyces spectabilis]